MAAVHPMLQESAPAQDAVLYRLLADTIPLMVWTADAEGRVDFVNRRVLDYTGVSEQALKGWDWEAVVHPDDRAACRATWEKALAGGARSENEMRLRRADGVYRWHHASGVPMHGPDGCVQRWFGVVTDVEDDVRALRATQARLRALIDTEPECVKLLDAQGRLLEMNAAGLRMIEAERADAVLGQCVYGLIAPEHAAAFRDLTERVCRGERGTLEFEMIGLKGARRWMETHAVPFRDEASGETRLLAITRDITERRRTERALRESEQRFQAFMDNLPASAWIRDAQFRYTYVNRQYAKTWGNGEPRSLIGRSAADSYPADLAEHFRTSDAMVRAEGSASQYVDDKPSGRWLKVKFPVPDGRGGVGVGGIAVDITARLDAEDKARRYAENVRSLVNRLVQAQEAERRRVADELHDLIGQNLTALGIDLQALKQQLGAGGPAVAPRVDAMAVLLDTTIDAIRGVMTDLRPPALDEFGLVPALRWCASAFSQRTGIKVATEASGGAQRLSRDVELALFRIVQETLTNAAKHSGCANVKIAIHYGDGLRLSVEDDGHGFVDPAGARSAKRGGFGLITMRERAEALGGSFRVEFPGRGTRVVVEIPEERHAD